MKKNYLLGFGLFLLAFFCGKSANAQSESTTTTKDIATYRDLVDAVKGVSDAAASKDNIAALKAEMDRLKGIADAVNPKYVTSQDKVSDVHNALSGYYNTISMASGQTATDETKVSYAIGVVKEQVGLTKKDVYTLYVTVPSVSAELQKNSTLMAAKGISGFREAVAKDVYGAIENGTETELLKYAFSATADAPTSVNDIVLPSKLVVIFKINNSGSVEFSSPTIISTYSAEERMGMFIPTLLNLCLDKSANLLLSDARYYSTTEVIEKNPDGSNKMTIAYADAWTAYEKAKTTYDVAVAGSGEYKDIKVLNITSDITVEGTDLSTYTLPADVTLNGNNYYITGINSTPLLAENNGDIENIIAVDGSIAGRNTGYANKVIVKAVTGKMRVYFENAGTDYDDIPSLVKANSGVYGYDLVKNRIEPMSDENRLYTATYYNANNKEGKTFDVNISGSEITDGKNLTDYPTDNNQFIYINDARITEGTIEQQNVVVNGVCSTAKIVEGADKADFYIPADFTAKTLDYDRNIQSDVASICLPFALGQDFLTNNETSGVHFYGYKGVDMKTKTVWFSQKTVAEANKPCVLAFNEGAKPGKIFNGLENVKFESTVGQDLALSPTDQSLGENGKRFRGNYRAGQFSGDLAQTAGNLGSDVYGFKDGKLVLFNEKARVNQFRSFVIYSVDITRSAGAMLQAGFLDEDGNEVTAVESVNADRNDNGGLKAVGGNGVIEISADKACNVKVYTAGGTFVKSLNVEAGNTSLPVNAGIYIVNKNKVVVK